MHVPAVGRQSSNRKWDIGCAGSGAFIQRHIVVLLVGPRKNVTEETLDLEAKREVVLKDRNSNLTVID